MDQLRAYEILGIEPGCSVEEIKEAYAALSKQYHPEEEPERFQQIHEAYVALTRGIRRRGGRSQSLEVQEPQNIYQEVQKPEESRLNFEYREIEPEASEKIEFTKEEKQQEFNFEKADFQQEVKQKQEYSFDDAMKKAEKQEQEKAHELVLEAAAELKILVSPKYQNSLKAFKAFLKIRNTNLLFEKQNF